MLLACKREFSRTCALKVILSCTAVIFALMASVRVSGLKAPAEVLISRSQMAKVSIQTVQVLFCHVLIYLTKKDKSSIRHYRKP